MTGAFAISCAMLQHRHREISLKDSVDVLIESLRRSWISPAGLSWNARTTCKMQSIADTCARQNSNRRTGWRKGRVEQWLACSVTCAASLAPKHFPP